MNSIRRIIILVVAALAAFLTINVGAAQAVQLYGASGSPGAITPYQVKGLTVNSCYPVDNCYGRQVQIPGPLVGRSPSGGNSNEDVRIQYRVYRWTGSAWALYSSVNKAYGMGTNASVRLPQVNFNVGSGYYMVQESLSWHLSSTGLTLGARSVNYNGNDYACGNQTIRCTVSTGWVQFA